jgi:hypothetical protein
MASVDPHVVGAVVRAARAAGVDPAQALAIALEESGGNPAALGDQGSSFGLYQLHRGGALGSLTPQQADDPYTNAMAVLPAWAKAGGGRGLSPEQALMQYYSQVGRGTSNTIPTQHALALLPQAQQLVAHVGQGSAPAPGVTPPSGGAGAPTLGGSLAPGALAAFMRYLNQSQAQVAAGKAPTDPFSGGLLKKLLAGVRPSGGVQQAAEMPASGAAPAVGGPLSGYASSYHTPFGTTFSMPALPSFVPQLTSTRQITTPAGQQVPIVDFQGHPIGSFLGDILNFASKHGWSGQLNSGYRSTAEQQSIWNQTPASRRGTYVAHPGSSPHNYAMAMDISAGPQFEQVVRQYKLPIARYAPEGWHFEPSGFRPASYHPAILT